MPRSSAAVGNSDFHLLNRSNGTPSIYDYCTISPTPDTGSSTAPVLDPSGSLISYGVIHTADDAAAIQAFLDLCQGKFCQMSPRTDGGKWKVGQPLFLQHDTTYDFAGATFQPTTTFSSPLGTYAAYAGGTTYAMGSKVSYGGKNYVYIGASSSSGNLPTNTTYWTPDLEGYVFELDKRDIPWYTDWKATITFNLGDRCIYKGGKYTSLINTNLNVDPRYAPASWRFDGDLYLQLEASPAAITSEIPASLTEHSTYRYTGSKIWIRNVLIDGVRTNFPGYNVDYSLDTSRRVGGIYLNESVTAGAISDDSDITAVDAYLTLENCRVANMTGNGVVVRGRGECKYSKIAIISCSMNGFVVNQYDANYSDIHIGNSGCRGLVVLREKSRDNRFVNIKSWYSGRNISKSFLITNAVAEAFRLDVLGELTLPWDDTIPLYAYGSTASSDQVTTLSTTERYLREDAYVGGVTDIASVTAAWTSGGADDTSAPYTMVGGTHPSSGLVTATCVMKLNGQPTANQQVLIRGKTLKFVSGTPSGSGQVQLGADATATAVNVADRINLYSTLFYCSATSSGDEITLSARLPGAAGNDISVANDTASGVTFKDVTGGGGVAVTKLRGGRYLPPFHARLWNSTRTYAIGARVNVGGTRDTQGIYTGGTDYVCLVANTNQPPASSPTYWTTTGAANAIATTNAPNNQPWTNYFGGEDMYIEAADCEFVACDTQDAFGESIRISGKRLRFVACCWTQGPDQPRRKYWAKDAIVLKTLSFSDSASYIHMVACSVKDESSPATAYAIGVQGSATRNFLDVTVPVALVGGDYHKVSGTLSNYTTRINHVETART